MTSPSYTNFLMALVEGRGGNGTMGGAPALVRAFYERSDMQGLAVELLPERLKSPTIPRYHPQTTEKTVEREAWTRRRREIMTKHEARAEGKSTDGR